MKWESENLSSDEDEDDSEEVDDKNEKQEENVTKNDGTPKATESRLVLDE